MRELSADETTARDWWHNKLSLNEQKAFAQEALGTFWHYFWTYLYGSPKYIHEIWVKKGRPS
jgi:hypothetical protein